MSPDDLFARRTRPALIGVIHLLPLPGSPAGGPGVNDVEARAVRDAGALVEGGADAVVVENLGDAPYCGGPVPPWTVAAMTRIALRVRARAPDLPLGINVLRNDALAALGVASAVGAAFIRVNVHTGAMITDQGWIEGRARDTLLARRLLGAPVRIAADVLVKHAVPPGPISAEQAARDTWTRGRADALIASGAGTGRPTDPERLLALRRAVPEAPVWVGSGLTAASAAHTPADAAIVGTALHRDDDLVQPLDPHRVAAIRAALER